MDEQTLAHKLCADLLSATELKELCRLRGFPVTGSGKAGLAAAAAARLLEPLGLPAALAALGPPWLMALHLVAAAPTPLPLGELRFMLSPARTRYHADLRALWQRVAAGLLSRGLVLVDEGATPARWEKSRFARYRLLVPAVVRPLLPPFPLPVEPVPGAGGVDAGDLERRALAAFAARDGARPERAPERDLCDRFAALLAVKDDHLRFGDLERPTAAQLRRHLEQCWEAGLVHRGKYPAPLGAGRLAAHILAHLPAGQGCRPAALAEALAQLGVEVDAAPVEGFCRDGASAGLCRAARAPDGALLAAAAAAGGAEPAGLALVAQAEGVRVEPRRSSLLAVLAAAAVCRASVSRGGLSLAPDPVRLGRAAERLATDPTVLALRAASPVFEAAVAAVLARHGQVIVHRGLTVLRVEDVGLRALLAHRFTTWVRPVAGAYLAVLESHAAEVLAFAGKQGYVARRLP